jgi:hypothetical protein
VVKHVVIRRSAKVSPCDPSTTVRLIKHEESYEVRVSTFFHFDDNAGRRSINNRPSPEQTLQEARAFAKQKRAT